MMRASDFVVMANENQYLSYKNGWQPSRPLPGPFISRLRDAWLVLIGEAEAVEFEKSHPKDEVFARQQSEIIR